MFLLLKPKANFIIFDQFAPVCLRNALAHGGAKTVIFLNCAQRHLFDEMLDICSGMTRNLRKLGFLFGRETHFHVPRLRTLPHCVNLKAAGISNRSGSFYKKERGAK